MSNGASAAIEHLINEEIRRLVLNAVTTKAVLSTSECVARVKATFPTCRMSKREIADKVLVVATGAGVPFEFAAHEKRSKRR